MIKENYILKGSLINSEHPAVESRAGYHHAPCDTILSRYFAHNNNNFTIQHSTIIDILQEMSSSCEYILVSFTPPPPDTEMAQDDKDQITN